MVLIPFVRHQRVKVSAAAPSGVVWAAVRRTLRELTEELGDKDSGLWLKAELGPDIPLENCHATLAAMEKYRRVKWATRSCTIRGSPDLDWKLPMEMLDCTGSRVP